MSRCVLLVTCPTVERGERIARTLVNKRLAACGNVTERVLSIYRWRGKIRRDSEVLLLLKTRRELVTACVREIERLHPYELPEILALPIVGGLSGYLKWVDSETKPVARA